MLQERMVLHMQWDPVPLILYQTNKSPTLNANFEPSVKMLGEGSGLSHPLQYRSVK